MAAEVQTAAVMAPGVVIEPQQERRAAEVGTKAAGRSTVKEAVGRAASEER